MRLVPVDDTPTTAQPRARRLVPLDAPEISSTMSTRTPFESFTRSVSSALLGAPVSAYRGIQSEMLRLGQAGASTPSFMNLTKPLGETLRRPLELLNIPTTPFADVLTPMGTRARDVAQETERGAQDIIAAGAADELLYGGIGAGLSRLGRLRQQAHPVEMAIDKYYTKAIRPSVTGQRTAGQMASYQDKAKDAVKTIYEFRSELSLPDEAGQAVARLPESLHDMSRAVDQTKLAIFKRYDALARQAGQQGTRASTQQAASAAAQVGTNRVLARYYPKIAQYAQQWAQRLRQAGSHSPEELQDLIAKLNADLETYYRNPRPGDAARAVVDAGIANNLRKSLDATIEGATGGQYQLLKRRYGALKAIERDVSRRAIIHARRNAKGLVDFSDIFSGGQIVHAIMTMDPALFARGAAQAGIARYFKHLNNPDVMIRKMFQGVERAYRSTSREPSVFAPPLQEASELAGEAGQAMTSIARRAVQPLRGQRGSVSLPKAGSPAHPFFSQAERLIQDRMPNAAPASQVRGILRSGGVKQDELNWLDLDSFLKDKPKVTKQEVLDYIKANNVQVQEVVKGGIGKERSRLIQARNIREGDTVLVYDEPIRVESVERDEDGIVRITFEGQSSETFDPTDSIEVSRTPQGPGGSTKFHAYQTPGGTNYRELLLTIPERETRTPVGEMAGGAKVYHEQESTTFRSPHFDEPNVLAHVRFNDRVDAQGKKVLFIEELQSDWHQKGRKEGYIEKPSDRAAYNAYQEQLAKKYGTVAYGDKIAPEELSRLRTLSDKLSAADATVPNAPFKKTWHELALKRMIRWAAEHGYDKLAWTTGEQQAARYDLSKQINEVLYTKKGDQYDILFIPAGGQTTQDAGMHLAKDLPNVVGKEVAEKIVNGEGGLSVMRGDKGERYHSLSGLDLKVGGEGMKGFYDQIVPSFLNRYAKKWGGRVSESVIKSREGELPDAVGVNLKVHSLDLTPAMRHSALREGQPLFQAAIGTTGTGLALQSMPSAEPQTDKESLLATR